MADVIKILADIKGKALDVVHFELLKNAYELQNKNIEQLKTNNEALEESIKLLKQKNALPIQENKEISISKIKQQDIQYGYEILSCLNIYKYHKINSKDNTIQLDILPIRSIRFLKEGDITVRTKRASRDTISSVSSPTNPVTSNHTGENKSTGVSEFPFSGVKPDDYEIIVLERKTKAIDLKKRQAKQEESDLLSKRVYQYFKTPEHDYAGTRAFAPTRHARLLIYFPIDHTPDVIIAFKVRPDGTETRSGTFTKKVSSLNLWVADCGDLEPGFGFFAVWKWKF